MRQIAEFVAVLACSLFAGAAVCISLVEHPARMECGVEIAAAEFPPSYRRASVMQAILAAVGLLSSVAAWLAGATFWWAVAGVLLGSVIPFTLIVVLPINKQLLTCGIPPVEHLSGCRLLRSSPEINLADFADFSVSYSMITRDPSSHPDVRH